MKNPGMAGALQEYFRRPLIMLSVGLLSLFAVQTNAKESEESPFHGCVPDKNLSPKENEQGCLIDNLSADEEALQTYMNLAQNSLDSLHREYPDNGPAIDLSQADEPWQQYVDIYCGHIRESYGRGSVAGNAALICRMNLNRERTHNIWSDYLAPSDSSVPVVPEPTTITFH